MIKKWILNNFKSIEESEKDLNLEFRPLTIFSGANSSGKSTILQSILMVTQTLQNPYASRSVVLNGWFKKFGSYSDIVSQRDANKDVNVGFSLEETTRDRRSLYYSRRLFESSMSRVDCDFTISSEGKEDNLQPLLKEMHIETYSGDSLVSKMSVHKRGLSHINEVEKTVIDQNNGKFPDSVFDYIVDADIKDNLTYYGDRIPWKYIGVGLYHFLPQYIIGYCTFKDQVKAYLYDYLLTGRSSFFEMEEDEETLVINLIKNKALSIAESIYKNKKYRVKIYEKYYGALKKEFSLSRLQSIFRVCTLDGDEKQKYISQLQDLLDALPVRYITERIPMFRQPGVDYVREFFSERIKYLGPLREEPKSLYPLESNGSTTDLGLKGENTAAVYENNKKRVISYISPDGFNDLSTMNHVRKSGTLATAINEWLVYLGVASGMRTDDRGKIGHELKITTDLPNMEQDLTHVGVGVSQVLPILVLSFLANEDDVIILEQPELHLHPKVQTRLADFFVTMNALGKQCIIETHSEYLINRLRLLVAINEETKVSDDIMIYFVEKANGHSLYRPVTINKYGVIEDWPDGFFDESEKIATQILRAGMEKKMKEDGQEYEE